MLGKVKVLGATGEKRNTGVLLGEMRASEVKARRELFLWLFKSKAVCWAVIMMFESWY